MHLSKGPLLEGAVAEGDWGRIHPPAPSGAPPRAGAEAGPYTAPSYVEELHALLHVYIHFMEIKAQCAQMAPYPAAFKAAAGP